jgi:hypothetical protein
VGNWIEWWCHLVGISDPGSVQIAVGIVGGGSALAIIYFLLFVGLSLFNSIMDKATR